MVLSTGHFIMMEAIFVNGPGLFSACDFKASRGTPTDKF